MLINQLLAPLEVEVGHEVDTSEKCREVEGGHEVDTSEKCREVEVGHEVDTSEKCRVLRQCVCKCMSVLPALGITFWPIWRKN